MTDIEITKLCAEAMGLKTIDAFGHPHIKHDHWPSRDTSCEKTGVGLKAYDPLHDNAQCFALVKKFGLDLQCRRDRNGWYVGIAGEDGHAIGGISCNADLNRAICECVAKMQQSKGTV